ncbi:UbiE family methyltransferase [Dichomitus squalens]|uniref:UbiE family methyltransferase n=1 Tax=Dichomitus squalens TaxID=114155 RepID=A0A4Q9PX06_9APHY|nr:UbiE family methyltransferase [Dichomitus squalens LYAD-421 SS1]EJF63286.1 UbiE family methyltransferase [Dichomitus squalens LYAD-421 SS1]TBU29993.1 UbiE family methyltransferase [Dichomitus squalens]TBU39240.1 UbiE family methyltransferase [Dichomitus squalens]TBU59016.1 UbiE family methyltransferase [Dichomitus squalens]
MSQKSHVYTHGHHESVLRSHSWRTVQNSAAYLIPHLKPNMTILDVGCGPGTITTDFAQNYVPQGHVTGLDVPDITDKAREYAASKGVTNITFTSGDALNLPFPDASFDIVHAHQVLQHVSDPVQVLREMRRVAKPGGLVATRENDHSAKVWWPDIEGLQQWSEGYKAVARANGGEPDAGRRLHVWAKKAGYPADSLTLSVGTWCFYTPEDRAWWGGLWADRLLSSNFAPTALKHGIFTQEGLEKVAEAWRRWGADEDAWCTLIHGELIAKV